MRPDILLKVIGYAVIPLTMAWIGNHLASKVYDNEPKRRLMYRAAFFVLVIVGVGGTCFVEWRSDRSHANEISSQHEDIQNLMGELRKSETGRQVDNAILRTKLEDYSQLSQLGPALMKLAQTSAEFQRKQYEAKVTSDKDLYALAMKSVTQIREFSKKYSALESENTLGFRLSGQMSDAERQQKWNENTNKMIQLSYAKQNEFQTSILPDAIYARNELLRKGLPEPPMDPMQKSEVNMVLHGALAGVYPELQFANYLEQMAKPLSRK